MPTYIVPVDFIVHEDNGDEAEKVVMVEVNMMIAATDAPEGLISAELSAEAYELY